MSAAEREAEQRWPEGLGRWTDPVRGLLLAAFVAGAEWQAEQDADLRAERDAAREALTRAHQTREAGVTAATEIARLRATLDAVRALHQPLDAINIDAPPGRQRTRVCAVCAGSSGPWAVWPCATIQAIEGDQT